LFAGQSKSESIDILKDHNLKVTDVLVIVDRQLQRKKDGPPLQKAYSVRVHSLITMDEIIKYMIQTKKITDRQLQLLIADYRQYERWDMPKFAKGNV
jgi:orotate phosphoribosyltransferase